MIGGTLKIIGLLLIVVGVLGLLGGLGAAGYGYMAEDENQEGLIADPEASDENEALITYGLGGAAVALLVLIVGIVLTMAGGSMAQRELVARANAAAEPASKKPGLVAGAVMAVLVVAALAMLLAASPFDGSASNGGLFSDNGGDGTVLDQMAMEGRVLDAYSTPVESRTLDSSESTQEFDAPAQTARIEGNLSWTPQDGGTDQLRIILEVQSGSQWIELTRVEGQGPLEFSASDEGLDNARLRFRVFPDADASVVPEQAFQVMLWFHSGP